MKTGFYLFLTFEASQPEKLIFSRTSQKWNKEFNKIVLVCNFKVVLIYVFLNFN